MHIFGTKDVKKHLILRVEASEGSGPQFIRKSVEEFQTSLWKNGIYWLAKIYPYLQVLCCARRTKLYTVLFIKRFMETIYMLAIDT